MGLVGRVICGEEHLAAQSISIGVVAVGRWHTPSAFGHSPYFMGRVLVRAAGGKRTGYGQMAACSAGAFYGVPDQIRAKAETLLTPHLLEVLHGFERRFVVEDSIARGE